MKNILGSVFVLLALISCSGVKQQKNNKKLQQPLAETFAYERAASIAQVLPMKMGDFILNKANSDKANVYLFLQLANNAKSNRSAITEDLNNISNIFCRDKKVSLVIAQGVSYYLIVKDTNQNIATAVINKQSCAAMDFIKAY